jgi:acetolactate synthase-1/2/3 large subunit
MIGQNANFHEDEVFRASDGGEAFVKILANTNTNYVFFNPGSDYYPVLEHFSKFELQGRKHPNPILCLSEQLALAMAHGYSMLSKKAQVVMVHVGIGTLQLGGAMHNAHRGRAPVMIVAGRSPFTLRGELPGSRDKPYHWDQELFDQAGLVREYTKWYYELKTNKNLDEVIARALQVANSEPQGPVYLVLPRELLAERDVTVRMSKACFARAHPVDLPQANVSTLEKIAKILLDAEYPVVITEYLGRNQDAVGYLMNVSELLGMAIVEPVRKRMNFPTNHPFYIPTFPKEVVEKADVILLLDVDVPWIPAFYKIRTDAKIIQIDNDPIKSNFPLWGFPIDIAVGASTELTLPTLGAILRKIDKTSLSSRIEERSSRFRSLHDEIRKKLKENADNHSQKTPLKIDYFLSVLNRLKKLDSIVMSEGCTNQSAIESYIDCQLPGTFFASGGSSLGDGLGNALGLKLAAGQGRDVISLIGDGGYVYSNPTAVFWTARRYDIPITVFILNNGGYRAMKNAVERGYPAGWSAKKNLYIGARIDDQLDYVMIAEACGGVGFRVEDPNKLEEVVCESIESTRRKKEPRSVVVDVVLESI